MRKPADLHVPASPWGLFLVLAVSNAFLSYGHLGYQAKCWVGLFGVVLPLALVLFDRDPGWGRAFQPSGKGPNVPSIWAWLVVAVFAAGIRLFHLSDPSFWPTLHEGTTGYVALELARCQEKGWFFPFNQMPLSYHWGLAWLLKIFKPTLALLWTYPALLSLASVVFIHRAAWLLMPRSSAFLLTAFTAAGFPMVYVGRFSLSHAALLFWTGLVLYIGARWHRAESGRGRTLWAALLGLALGAGIHVYYSWAVVMAVAIPVFLLGNASGKNRRLDAALFGSLLVLAVAPVAVHMMFKSRWSYILMQVDPSRPADAPRLSVALSYLTSLFWGTDTDLFAYKPVWGGFLNPVAGSLFLLGALALFKRRPPLAWAGLAAFLLLMVPAWVSTGYEYLRLTQVFPLLIAGASYGLWVLTRRSKGRAFLLAAVVLAASASLDAYHLAGSYRSYWAGSEAEWFRYNLSPTSYRAYGILRAKASIEGAGILYMDFVMDPVDRTLWFATQKFNGMEDPALRGKPCRWAALMVNAHYRPFLAARFPGSRWFWLSEGLGDTDNGQALGILPLPGEPPVPLSRWRAAHEVFAVLNRAVLWKECDEPDRSAEILEGNRASFSGDPFLESLYWERMFQSLSMSKKPALAMRALESAVQKGYPAAHLFNEIGILRAMAGDRAGARQAFKSALASPENHTLADGNLELLK
jgi:4-amino-4-deoxy-L-arabinose transferase-like glycosyltransferase